MISASICGKRTFCINHPCHIQIVHRGHTLSTRHHEGTPLLQQNRARWAPTWEPTKHGYLERGLDESPADYNGKEECTTRTLHPT